MLEIMFKIFFELSIDDYKEYILHQDNSSNYIAVVWV
jgi:hypothetical protein